jgi:serine/threonine protein kinase
MDQHIKRQVMLNLCREAHISHLACSNHHLHVAQFLGVEEYHEDGEQRMGLVYQWMNGGSMQDVLMKGKQYESNKRSNVLALIRMALEAAQGLLECHQQGIVHRDVATRNLLLDHNHRVWFVLFGWDGMGWD